MGVQNAASQASPWLKCSHLWGAARWLVCVGGGARPHGKGSAVGLGLDEATRSTVVCLEAGGSDRQGAWLGEAEEGTVVALGEVVGSCIMCARVCMGPRLGWGLLSCSADAPHPSCASAPHS